MSVNLDVAKVNPAEKPLISKETKDILIRIGKIAVVAITATAILAVSAGILFVGFKLVLAAEILALLIGILTLGAGIGSLLSLKLLDPRDNEALANMFKVSDHNGQDCIDFVKETCKYTVLFIGCGFLFPITIPVMLSQD
jgi:hypothetical protein